VNSFVIEVSYQYKFIALAENFVLSLQITIHLLHLKGLVPIGTICLS